MDAGDAESEGEACSSVFSSGQEIVGAEDGASGGNLAMAREFIALMERDGEQTKRLFNAMLAVEKGVASHLGMRKKGFLFPLEICLGSHFASCRRC